MRPQALLSWPVTCSPHLCLPRTPTHSCLPPDCELLEGRLWIGAPGSQGLVRDGNVLGLGEPLRCGLLVGGGESSSSAPGSPWGWDGGQHLPPALSLPTPSVGFRLPKFMASEHGPARALEGGEWRQAAGWQVAGGAVQGSPAAPLPVGEGPGACPWGRLHKPSCAGPRLPSRLACAPACLSLWLLPPTRGWHPCSQSCSLDCVSITTGLARGRPDTRARPPITGRPLFLPHFAADSSPKQNRLSPFPPSGSSSLACGCLLRRCRRRRPGRGGLGRPCRDWDGAPGFWPSRSPVCGRRASFAVAVA